MKRQKSIRERCHVNGNAEGDRFVGLKSDAGDATVCFPIGYHLPSNDNDLRADIIHLLRVLAAFMQEDKLLAKETFTATPNTAFPIYAYLKIIRNFQRTRCYYVETEPYFKTDTKGNASWPRTVRNQRAFVLKNGSAVFLQMTVRATSPNVNKKITQIHRYCVYQAFDKMGWLYGSGMPEKPGPHPDRKESIYILEKKLASTHNDAEQELFSAMVSMLKYEDEIPSEDNYIFGTEYFEYIWQKMIDRAFGIKEKNQYFPRTRWLLNYGEKIKRPLQPDTIMVCDDKFYILDAKLYRYGCSGNPDHLPNGSDINKQITYGEHVERANNISSQKLYNAFIMPFDKEKNIFHEGKSNKSLMTSAKDTIKNIGEAVADWKPDPQNYERVQGIVMDTRFLMYNYMDMPEQQKRKLIEEIEKVDSKK